MTISAPRELLREFMWLCHRREKSASEVLREFMQGFVDSRFAEIESRDAVPQELRVFDGDADVSRNEIVVVEMICCEAAACGPRGGDP